MYDEALFSPLQASTPNAHYTKVRTRSEIMEEIITSPEVEPLNVVSPGSSGLPTPVTKRKHGYYDDPTFHELDVEQSKNVT